jgi:5-methylcytosine-specific restriction endonuclease McrA
MRLTTCRGHGRAPHLVPDGATIRGICAACSVSYERERAPARRRYKTAAWQRLRRVVFERDNWTCVDCGHCDETGNTLEPDHEHYRDFYNPDSIRTRCLSCARKRHARRARARA